ncbi:MAG: gluconate 2-dehydrogenase subunit 3 family protein [Gemmatimonadales bacterium]
MTDRKLTRREVVSLLAAAVPLASIGPNSVARAVRQAQATLGADTAFVPKFFTAHEWATVRTLVDIIIPKDEHSGSATDAAVPEFMDFILVAYPDEQKWMRGGLAWLDAESKRRSKKSFLSSSTAERKALLDDIAYPEKAPPAMQDGVKFFNGFRDFTASGFYSSRMGVDDLQYKGNTVVAEWKGCPDAVLDRLGVHY